MSNSIQLGTLIKKAHLKYDDRDSGKPLEAFGVSNTEGITRTAHRKSEDLSNYLVIEPGSFAYNPYRINVGSIGLTPAGLSGIVSPAYIVFRVKKGKLVPEVLLEFLKSSEGLRQINKLARGTVRKALRYDDLCEIEFPNIPFERQLQILKDKRDFNEGHHRMESQITLQQSLLGKLKQAILQEAIQGKLTEDWRAANPDVEPASELLQRIQVEKARLIAEKKIRKEKPLPEITPEEIPFEIPEGWPVARIGDIAYVVRGGSPRPAGDPRFYGGNIPFLKVADLTNDEEVYVQGHAHTISEAGLSKTRFVDEEIVLLTNSGATLGIPKILDFPSAFNDGVAAFLCLPELINKRLLYYFLKSKTAWFLAEVSKGIGQPNLNTDIIKGVTIAIPPPTEQIAIVERVEALMAICRELETEIEHSRTHAADLLQAVLKEAFATQSSAPEYKPYQPAFARQLLAVEILYRHNEDDMNQMKLQKLIHLCEHHAQIPDVQGQYQRAAAGPYDNHLMHPLAATLRKQNWFRRNGRYQDATYTALEKAGSHQKYLGKWEKCLPKINELLTLVGPLSPERCEIISTLYAAWNDLIIDGKMPTDTEILTEVSADRWHEKKGRIDTPRWKKALKWMRDQNLIPTGFGKRTVLPSKK